MTTTYQTAHFIANMAMYNNTPALFNVEIKLLINSVRELMMIKSLTHEEIVQIIMQMMSGEDPEEILTQKECQKSSLEQ